MSKTRSKEDEFRQPTKNLLARRVGYRCSNPNCRKPTSGPEKGGVGFVNLGKACHIKAAGINGPRYDEFQTPEDRRSYENGIWMCGSCSDLIDKDFKEYSVEDLNKLKVEAEDEAYSNLINENFKLRKELEFVIDSIEGKDSYPSLGFHGLMGPDGLYLQFHIHNRKFRPLYDVVVQYHDPDEVAKFMINGISSIAATKLYKRVNLGNLPPSLITNLGEPARLPEKAHIHYLAYIGTRNGVYYQELFCSAGKGANWILSTKLEKYIDDKGTKEIIQNKIQEIHEELNWIL